MAFPMFFSIRVPSTAWTADLLINVLHVISYFVSALLGYLVAYQRDRLTVSNIDLRESTEIVPKTNNDFLKNL